jgi:hypothetical protein
MPVSDDGEEAASAKEMKEMARAQADLAKEIYLAATNQEKLDMLLDEQLTLLEEIENAKKSGDKLTETKLTAEQSKTTRLVSGPHAVVIRARVSAELAESRRPDRATTMPSGMVSMLLATSELRGGQVSGGPSPEARAGMSAFC